MDKQIKWKDVFNCQKLFPLDMFSCKRLVKSVGYQYMSFNGLIYDVTEDTSNYICTEKDLII